MKERFDKLIAYLVAQGRQPSTWRGVILVGTAVFGWSVPFEKQAAIVTIGIGLAGAIGMLLPDELKKPEPPKDPPA